MLRWELGHEAIEIMLRDKQLERIPYDKSFIQGLIKKAKGYLKDAEEKFAKGDYDKTTVNSYEAMRFYAMAYLAQQGLRQTSKGGHIIVEDAILEQSNRRLHFYGLRSVRHAIEYPKPGGKARERQDAKQAIEDTYTLFKDFEKIIDKMPMF